MDNTFNCKCAWFIIDHNELWLTISKAQLILRFCEYFRLSSKNAASCGELPRLRALSPAKFYLLMLAMTSAPCGRSPSNVRRFQAITFVSHQSHGPAALQRAGFYSLRKSCPAV
eukprot:6204777-Pleurochrysis_carterae.AAC.5